MLESINKIPLILSNMVEKFDNAGKDLMLAVKTPAIMKINPCASENRNNIEIPKIIFELSPANAIILAKTGVEQGVPASAKTIPRKNGYKYK